MGYELHIEREDVLDPVTMEQWRSYVESDPEMEFAPGGKIEIPLPDDDVLSYRNEGLAIWTGHSRHGLARCPCAFDYRDGGIHVNGPNDETIEKMKRIADGLGADLLGDEGEKYNTRGDSARS